MLPPGLNNHFTQKKLIMNNPGFIFRNRIEAGFMLAKKLMKYRNKPGIVLAVPKGGLPVGYVVAKELGFPLEVILTKKIGHPLNKEYAIGAVSLTDAFIAPNQEVSEEYIQQEIGNIRSKLKEMNTRLMNGEPPVRLEGKTIILVDDGIATGNTLLGAIGLLKKSKPAAIIIAVPVAAADTVKKLQKEVDDVITVITPEILYGVGRFYEEFNQVTEDEAIYYLRKLKELRKAG